MKHETVYFPPKGYDLPDSTLTFTYFSKKGENLFLDKLENVHVFTEDELKDFEKLIKTTKDYLNHSRLAVRETHWEDALRSAIRGIENRELFKNLNNQKSHQ